MSRPGKLLLVFLPLAIILTVGFRFIQHTDREYSKWIEVYGESARKLDEHCAAVKTAGVCASAQQRKSFLAELRRYRESVLAWWWPALAAMLCAWAAAIAAFIALARRLLFRRRASADQNIEKRR